jgi:hypothetical protein
VQPMLITSMIVLASAVAMIIVTVQYRARHKDGVEMSRRPEFASVIRQDHGHVVIPSGSATTGKAGDGKKPAAATKQQQATALEHQVDDTIRRLILMN